MLPSHVVVLQSCQGNPSRLGNRLLWTALGLVVPRKAPTLALAVPRKALALTPLRKALVLALALALAVPRRALALALAHTPMVVGSGSDCAPKGAGSGSALDLGVAGHVMSSHMPAATRL